MRKISIYILIFAGFIFFCYSVIGYISSYIGWYGYKKWEYRKHSTNIEESIKRGVFVKELNFKIEYSDSESLKFRPFIEKGFKYGHNTSRETVPMMDTKFPYQLSFDYKPDQSTTISIEGMQLKKFDSSNSSWGYLRMPELTDTILLLVKGDKHDGLIKVW